ncbi:MAG: flavodoxin family protein [Bacteroidales bacterium]
MRVVVINGSPRKKGNTSIALEAVCKVLRQGGVETEFIHVGNKNIHGCIACNKCVENKNERCIINNDEVNEWLQILKDADGILLGSPVYYAGIAGTMKCFLDRAFYVAYANGGWFTNKVGAGVVALRRGGATATYSGLNFYLGMSQMLIPTSTYWNMAHGAAPGEAICDGEGMQVMENLGKTFLWLLQMKEATKEGVPLPVYNETIRTNFIR